MKRQPAKKLVWLDVKLMAPADATDSEVMAYVREAIAVWNGSFHPDDTLFGAFSGARDISVKPR